MRRVDSSTRSCSLNPLVILICKPSLLHFSNKMFWLVIWCRDSAVYHHVSVICKWRIVLLIDIYELRAFSPCVCVQGLRNLEHHGKGWEEPRVPLRAWRIRSSEKWSSSMKGWMVRPSEYSRLAVLAKSAWIVCLWGTMIDISWLMQGLCSQSTYSKLYLAPAFTAVEIPLFFVFLICAYVILNSTFLEKNHKYKFNMYPFLL